MAEVTAAQVKELRVKTGAGMMDCKRALVESDGDMEAAVDWLRKKGLAAAAKKTGRVAADGLIGVAVANRQGALVEVNTETDFVSRNKAFQDFVKVVSELALEADGSVEALKAKPFPGTGRSVAEELTQLIATMGENMCLRRVATLSVEQGVLGAYVHNAAQPGLGKIGVLVALGSAADPDKLAPLAKQLAMHVAAANPQVVSREDLDAATLAHEREILAEQARASGKPEAIVEKMVEGRLRRFYQEVCLADQTFVIDGETQVGKVVADAAEEAGADVRIAGFIRFALGEGIDKDSAEEAATAAEA